MSVDSSALKSRHPKVVKSGDEAKETRRYMVNGQPVQLKKVSEEDKK